MCVSLVWLGVYAHYLNSVTVDCCAVQLKHDPFWQPLQCGDLSEYDVVSSKNVSQEFHAVCAWAIGLLVISTLAALATFFGEKATKVAYICLLALCTALIPWFIAANVLLFRHTGRACSMVDYIVVEDTPAYTWYRMWIFQWRAHVAIYVLAVFVVGFGCTSGFCAVFKRN